MPGAALQIQKKDVSERDSRGDDALAAAILAPSSPPGVALAALKLDLVTDLTAFAALEPEWNALFDRAGRGAQLFQTFNWSWHWCRHYLDDGAARHGLSLAIVTGRRAGRLVLVMPLVLERLAGVRVLGLMGAPVSQYGDVLIDDRLEAGPLLQEAWRFATGRLDPDLVWLRKVRADAAIAPLMADVGAVAIQRLEAPFMDLANAGDFEAHLQRRSSRFKKRQRAAARRLDQLGPVACERRTEGFEARNRARHAVALKRSQLKADGIISPAVSDLRMSAFFGDAAAGRDRAVGLHVVSLAVSGELSAVDVFLGCKDRAALHVVAYDLRFEKAGVGSLLLQHTIAEACAAGFTTFDFLAPADPYKLKWADGVVGVSDWVITRSWKGRVFARFYLDLARPALKRAFSALPLAVRRFLAERTSG